MRPLDADHTLPTSKWELQKVGEGILSIRRPLPAKLYFHDTFEIFNSEGSAIAIRRDNLINLFKREPNSEKTQWIDPTLESFQIWMATSVNPVV